MQRKRRSYVARTRYEGGVIFQDGGRERYLRFNFKKGCMELALTFAHALSQVTRKWLGTSFYCACLCISLRLNLHLNLSLLCTFEPGLGEIIVWTESSRFTLMSVLKRVQIRQWMADAQIACAKSERKRYYANRWRKWSEISFKHSVFADTFHTTKLKRKFHIMEIEGVNAEYPATFVGIRWRSLKNESKYSGCYSYANKCQGSQHLSSKVFHDKT